MSIRDELLAHKDESGVFHCEAAHEWARRHKASALHAALEWNNDKAGYEYRLEQIRRLVRIHVVSVEGDRQLVSLSVDRAHPRGGYRDLNDVLRAPDMRHVLLDDALRELERVEKKYSRLQELAAVFEEVRKVRVKRQLRVQVNKSKQAQHNIA